MRHGIIATAQKACCTSSCLGDGSHVIFRQRVRGSVRAVRAVWNTPVFQMETRADADGQRPYHIKHRWFIMLTVQLRLPILIREFRAWELNLAALRGASFVVLQFSTSSKLGKWSCRNIYFGAQHTVFSKPLAEFWRYQKLESTKRCAMQSCIIHIPVSRLSDQYWWR
jgi:hypothetical protein